MLQAVSQRSMKWSTLRATDFQKMVRPQSSSCAGRTTALRIIPGRDSNSSHRTLQNWLKSIWGRCGQRIRSLKLLKISRLSLKKMKNNCQMAVLVLRQVYQPAKIRRTLQTPRGMRISLRTPKSESYLSCKPHNNHIIQILVSMAQMSSAWAS